MNPIISYHLFATYYAIMIHLILNKFISIHFQFKYSKISAAENGNVKKGVIFSTYSSLIGESQSSGKYRTRMKMLLNWCGADFDGVVSFLNTLQHLVACKSYGGAVFASVYIKPPYHAFD